MHPREYLRIFRLRWLVVVAVVVVAAGAGWVTAPGGPKPVVFQATAVVVVDQSAGIGGVTLAPISPELVGLSLRGGEVPQRVAGVLGGSPQALAGAIGARADGRGGTVAITANQPDGEAAVTLARTFATELIAWDHDRNVGRVEEALGRRQAQAAEVSAELADVEARLATTADRTEVASLNESRLRLQSQVETVQGEIGSLQDYLDTPDRSRVVLAAEPYPQRAGGDEFAPPRSRPARAALAGLVGLLVGGALAIFLHRTDLHLQSRPEAERAFDLPVVAEIPPASVEDLREWRVATYSRPRSRLAEAYRSLRTAVALMPLVSASGSRNGSGPQERERGGERSGASGAVVPGSARKGTVVVVTSAGPAEGKTTTVANLAASWAEAGSIRVLVVSADTRKPTIHHFLGVGNDGPGLSDAVREDADPAALLRLVRPTAIPGVYLLTTGTLLENPAAIVEGVGRVVVAASHLAEIVLVDTPPVLVTNDALELTRSADAVVVMARVGQTTRDAGARAAELLRRVGSPLVGTCLIGSPALGSGYGAYGYREDGYYDEVQVARGNGVAAGPAGSAGGRRRRHTRAPS